MKRSVLLLSFLLGCLPCAIGQHTDNIVVTGNFVRSTVFGVAEAVKIQTGYRLFFDGIDSNSLQPNIVVDRMPLDEFLRTVFKGFYIQTDSKKNIFITATPLYRPFESSMVSENTQQEGEIDESRDMLRVREKKLYEIGSTLQPGDAILSGMVRTHGSGEVMNNVVVRVVGATTGAVTDNTGIYSLKLQPGRYQLSFTSVGYKATVRNILVRSSGKLNVEMEVEVTNLQEVEVNANYQAGALSPTLGAEKFNIQTIKMVPATFGESDVLKAVLTLPGVKSIGEASTGFNVRGGATDQNLILFNGSTIYNPFHFFGFFSSFNPEAVEDVELYKGSVPAAYGGRLSSVLNVTGREGSKNEFRGSAGIGLLTGRVLVEGPIIKDKTSFIVGARKTYSNWIFQFMPQTSGYRGSEASFYDVNLSLDHATAKDRFRLSGYLSKDEANLNTDTTYNYTNRNLSFEWDHRNSQKFGWRFTVALDHFDYGNFSDSNPLSAYDMRFAIDQTKVQIDFDYELDNVHQITAGLGSVYYKLKPGDRTPLGDESLVERLRIPNEQGLEGYVHAEDVITISKSLSVNAGVRYSWFGYLGENEVREYVPGLPRTENNVVRTVRHESGELINTYHGPEARLSARYLLAKNFSIKAGYTMMRQYIHMLSNSIAISPTDIWKLSDPNIKPQLSEQLSLGLYKTFGSGVLETSVETYTKRIENYLDYKSGAVLVLNPAVEQETLSTQGKAYGIEFLIKKPSGNFNGWLSYTYSRILLQANDPLAGEKINRGEYYPASYDKPHDFNFTGNQKISRRLNVTLNTTYSTGRPVTIPIGVFNYGGAPKTLFSQRNEYRIPDYFRMDISVNLEGNHKVRQLFKNSWTFGVYNLTGRRNPYSVFFTNENGVINGYKLSIFGSAIPFVNYNIKFR